MYKENHKKSKKFLIILYFCAFQLLFAGFFTPLLVFYGPFKNVRDSFVGTAMTTYSHQYLATFFLSDETIRTIMGTNVTHVVAKVDELPEESLVTIDKSKRSDKVQVYNIDGGTFEGKMIKVSDPTRVVIGYTQHIPKAGETTSSIAKRNESIAAINAGGFVDIGFTGTGGAPLGFIFHDGKLVYSQQDRDDIPQDTIAFTKEGKMIVGRFTIRKLRDLGVKEGVSFGPPLVMNGKPTITVGDGGWGIAPRTAIGQTSDGSVLLLTIDGRSIRSAGARLVDVQNIFLEHKAVIAANLDGGSSTTMFYDGKVINRPSDSLGERTVPTVFMVTPEKGIMPF